MVKLKLPTLESKKLISYEVALILATLFGFCGCFKNSHNAQTHVYISVDDGLTPKLDMLEPFYDSIVIELVDERGEGVFHDEDYASEVFRYAFPIPEKNETSTLAAKLLQDRGWSHAAIVRSKLFILNVGETYSVNVRIKGHTKDLVKEIFKVEEARSFRKIRIPKIEAAKIDTSETEVPIKNRFENQIEIFSELRFLFHDQKNPSNYVFPAEETGTTTAHIYATAGSVSDFWLVNIRGKKSECYKANSSIYIKETGLFPLGQSFRVDVVNFVNDETGPTDYVKLIEQRR